MKKLIGFITTIFFITSLFGQQSPINNLALLQQNGYHLDSLQGDQVGIQEELTIFQDTTGKLSFEAVRQKEHLFKANKTLDIPIAEEVYWAKLTLNGYEEYDSTAVFHLSPEGVRDWKKVAAWLVHEDGSIDQQVTGNSCLLYTSDAADE